MDYAMGAFVRSNLRWLRSGFRGRLPAPSRRGGMPACGPRHEQGFAGGAQGVRRLIVGAADRAVQEAQLLESAKQLASVVRSRTQRVRYFADRQRVAGS